MRMFAGCQSGVSRGVHGRARGGGCGQEPAGEIGQGGCLCAGGHAADWVVPRGVGEVGRQSPAEGHAGGARSVGASQTCARQSGARTIAAVWHSTAVAAGDQEVCRGGASGGVAR